MCESEGLLSLTISQSVSQPQQSVSQSINLLHVHTHTGTHAAVQGWEDTPSFAYYFLGFRKLAVQVGCSHLPLAPYEALGMTPCHFQI